MHRMTQFRFEHKFLEKDTANYEWLEHFLKETPFKRLWIKVFALDKYYSDILREKYLHTKFDLRVMMDDTRNQYSNSPLQNLLKWCKVEDQEAFSQQFFPLRSGNLHNKYISFESEDEESIEFGLIAGSLNLTKSSEKKDNDLLLYSFKIKKDGLPGMPRLFSESKEEIFSLNIGMAKYDFSKSWSASEASMKCPLCGEDSDLDFSIHCPKMTMGTGTPHFFIEPKIGIFGECDECPAFCREQGDEGVYFVDLDDNRHGVWSCGSCDALFTDECGLIGQDMVPFMPLEETVEDAGHVIVLSLGRKFTFDI